MKQKLNRRHLLVFGGAALASGTAAYSARQTVWRAEPDSTASYLKSVTLAKGDDAPLSAPGFPDWSREKWRSLDDEAWQERLSNAAFRVLRQEATERPFTSPLNDEKRDGWFACAGCGQVLFSSDAKYDSGTGWPSFYEPVAPERLGTKKDNKLWITRIEYHCARCGGHQGHVFNDGPRPTGLRYCNNGVALSFLPASELA